LGGHGFPSEGGESMRIKDAIAIMLMFATFIIALLSYIAMVYQAK
jgi:hypothetical protein